MSQSTKKLVLVEVGTMQEFQDVTSAGLDVNFPAGICWSDVLDCRIAPYAERTVEENCDFADHVHKTFILIAADHLGRTAA